MKTNISIKQVRADFRAISKVSVNNVLSVIYAYMDENRDIQANTLREIMPASKKQAKSHASSIVVFGKIGQYKTAYRRKADGEITGGKARIIKPSVDIVLRYFTLLYNNAVPENAK